MTGADAIVKILQIEGIDKAFCFPSTPLLEAMALAGLRVITARQERVAGNMADGVSRSTNGRQMGVFTIQQLAGSENAFAAVAHSFTDSTPVLVLPGYPAVGYLGTSPTFDSVANYSKTTKMAQKIISSEQIVPKLRQAFTALRSGRPQPVMLELPGDVCAFEIAGAVDYAPVPRMAPAPRPGAAREAAERLLAAKCPLIWAGQGVLYAEAARELQTVAEISGAPVMTSLQGKSAFPESHELSAGVGAHSATDMAAYFLRESDLIFAVGTSLSRAPFTPRVPPGKTIVHATIDSLDLNKEYATDLPIVADAKLFLAEVAEELRSRATGVQDELRTKNSEKIASLKRAWLAEYEPLFSDNSSPINGYRMFRELWNAIDPDTSMITHEAGASRDIQCVFYQSTVPRSYLGWGQSSQLGFSLGLAMGAKIANPDKLVVNVMGDGSAGMTGMDWETAVRERAPIMTVVKHDSIFSGYDRAIPEAAKRYQTSTQTGDYAGVAKALGCHTERVTEPGELRPAYDRAIRATREGRPAVVDVITAETRKLSRPAEWGSPI
jgi:thiamine pyrophosphate-dependent acetolactate synthase large subunit-like protein